MATTSFNCTDIRHWGKFSTNYDPNPSPPTYLVRQYFNGPPSGFGSPGVQVKLIDFVGAQFGYAFAAQAKVRQSFSVTIPNNAVVSSATLTYAARGLNNGDGTHTVKIKAGTGTTPSAPINNGAVKTTAGQSTPPGFASPWIPNYFGSGTLTRVFSTKGGSGHTSFPPGLIQPMTAVGNVTPVVQNLVNTYDYSGSGKIVFYFAADAPAGSGGVPGNGNIDKNFRGTAVTIPVLASLPNGYTPTLTISYTVPPTYTADITGGVDFTGGVSIE